MAKWKFWQTQPQDTKILSAHSFSNDIIDWDRGADYNLSNPIIDDRRGNQYVLFGEDNLYPQILLDMYHGSPFHAAIINFKTKAIMADGLEFSINKLTGQKNSLEDEILLGKVKDKLNRAFFKSFVQDYLIHDRVYVSIDKKGDKATSFKHVPSEQVRRSLPNENLFYINPDWRFYGRNEISEITRYNKFSNKDHVQLMEFQSLKPGFPVYGIPEYSSAANWIELDRQISFFQKSNIENSINPSAIIKFYQDIANKEEKAKFIQGLKHSYTSAQNAGKVMVFFASSKEASPDITIAEPNKLDKAFAGVQENIIRNVSYSHQIIPAIMGIASAGKLGTGSELNESFAIFQKIFLNDAQDSVEEYLNELVKVIDPNISVKIKRQSVYLPVTESKNE